MDLTEKVARAMCADGGFSPDERMPNDGPRWKYYEHAARGAIAVCAEKMAKVAETEAVECYHNARSKDYRTEDEERLVKASSTSIAAAIRSMGEKG